MAEDCAICFRKLPTGTEKTRKQTIKLDCAAGKHVFHTKCIAPWVCHLDRKNGEKTTCPLCRHFHGGYTARYILHQLSTQLKNTKNKHRSVKNALTEGNTIIEEILWLLFNTKSDDNQALKTKLVSFVKANKGLRQSVNAAGNVTKLTMAGGLKQAVSRQFSLALHKNLREDSNDLIQILGNNKQNLMNTKLRTNMLMALTR